MAFGTWVVKLLALGGLAAGVASAAPPPPVAKDWVSLFLRLEPFSLCQTDYTSFATMICLRSSPSRSTSLN